MDPYVLSLAKAELDEMEKKIYTRSSSDDFAWGQQTDTDPANSSIRKTLRSASDISQNSSESSQSVSEASQDWGEELDAAAKRDKSAGPISNSDKELSRQRSNKVRNTNNIRSDDEFPPPRDDYLELG